MTNTHWAEYLTRGIITLLSFSNLGTGIRCFMDSELVVNRLFQSQFKGEFNFRFSNCWQDQMIQNLLIDSSFPPDNTLSHLFGTYSILLSLIFSQSAIYIYVYP